MTTDTMPDLRERRAEALIPTVRKVEGGYRVSASSHDIEYLVTKPNGTPVCTCTDFQRHVDQPEYQCKHILAVIAAHKEGRLVQSNGNMPPDAIMPPTAGEMHIIHRYLSNEDPVRLKLIKNTKGYSWEISVSEPDPETALATLRDVEARVRTEFGESPDSSP